MCGQRPRLTPGNLFPFHEVAVEGQEGVAPGVEAQKGVVAAAQDAESGKQGFDGGAAVVRVGAWILERRG